MASFSLHPVTSATGTFCGEYRRAIVNRIVDESAKVEPASFGIYGGRRMGKSSILYEIQERFTCTYAPEDTCVVVGYVDLGADTPSTKRKLFQCVYLRLSDCARRHCRDENYQDELDNYSETCNLNLANRDPELAFKDFAEAYAALMQIMRRQYADAKVIILLDEIAHLSNRPWSTEISANLRAFLTNRHYYPYCTKTILVIAGTTRSLSRLLEKRGSPLENELIIFPLRVFSEDDTRELVMLYPYSEASDKVVRLVHELSGGHPMAIQYILKMLVEAKENKLGANKIVNTARSFATDKNVFANWVDDFLPLERHLYRKLATSDGLSKPQIRYVLDIDEIDDALYTLTYTGVVEERNGTYFAAGTLFRNWFLEHGFGKEKPKMAKHPNHRKGPSSSQLVISALVAVIVFAATIGVLVWAASRVSGTALILVVIVGLLFDLVSIVFVLVVNGVITRKQAMDFYNSVLGKVPILNIFLGKSREEEPTNMNYE